MKNYYLITCCFLAIFCCSVLIASAQCRGGSCSSTAMYKREGPQWAKNDKKQGKGIYLDSTYVYPEHSNNRFVHAAADDEEEEFKRFDSWEKKGLEMYFGGGIYFASKKTANFYNGAPENEINLNLFNNEFYWRPVFELLKRAYPYIGDSANIRQDYNYESRYQIAMDIAVGFKYRFHKNFFFDLSYSFRRLTCSNRFIFDFPAIPDANKENPPYSKWQDIVAREDRHYIDLSVGYILQKHSIVKPFISLGVQFTYIRIKDFHAIFEGDERQPVDLLKMARYPDYIPGVMDMPNYVDWAGPGYGFSLVAGFKIAFHPAVSLDPIFQLSVTTLGNNKINLQGFNTNFCFNYVAGIRLVLNDALFGRK